MEALILTLALLACPVGMGVMMWFMMRGSKGESAHRGAGSGSIAELREEQRRLAGEIGRLEDGRDEHGETSLERPRPEAA